MHNGRIYYHQNYVLEVAEEIGAVLGFRTIPGESLSFYYDSEIYKNFTITEDGITGDLVDVGETTQPFQIRYGEPVQALGVLSNDWSPATRYGADGLLCAIYITDVTTEQSLSTSAPKILFYDEARDRFDSDYYYNSGGNTTSSLVISDNAKVELINYQNGNIVHETYTMGHLFGSYVPQINNAWITAGYAQWVKWGSSIPIFDTEEHAKAYLRDPSITEGLLNKASNDPYDEYEKQFDYWFIYSTRGHNTRNSSSPSNVSDFLRWPKSPDDKICFLLKDPTRNSPYNLELHYYTGMQAYRADSRDGDYEPTTNVPNRYLDRSISFGMDDYYTQFGWLSNLPRADSEQQMEDYFNGLIDISQMSNFSELARIDNSIIQSDWDGLDIDAETSLGTNGMQYGYGLRLYAMTNIELASLFNELFDRANIDDILDGTKLYGSASDCVAGIMYLPINDLSAICNLGSLSKVWIGSWQAENAEGKRIINNTGLIDCGSFTMTPSYCDFRDFEPYTLLFVMLPFIGFKQLTLSKYLSQSTPKTISVKYAIDVSTGGCCAMILADGKLMDLFEGTCGASRPFSAIDNNGYVNQCISAITGASNSASGSVSGVANAVSDAGKMAAKSGAMGAVGVGGVAVAGAGTAISGIYQGYQIKQAVDNPPIMQRGNLTGNLSYYTIDKVTFLIAKKRTIRPENELNVIGYPSGHGGMVGQFSGFLKCSAFMLADGFIGSEAERAMILDEMEKGVYI